MNLGNLSRAHLPCGYRLRRGSGLHRAVLVKFMQHTYQELYPEAGLTHLAQTVERYLSSETPLWWVDCDVAGAGELDDAQMDETQTDKTPTGSAKTDPARTAPIACLWLGLAIDQVSGQQYPHIFLLYVSPAHRRLGIGAALVRQAEDWAKARGDSQIGLQVFQQNQPALSLYQKLGFRPQWLGMVKPLQNQR